MDALIIHQIAWGDLYRQMLFDYSIPSLIPSYQMLKERGVPLQWIVHIDRLEDQRTYPGVEISYRPTTGPAFSFDESKAVICQAANQHCYIALIAPDSVHARETLYNAYRIAQDKDVGVAVANPRVLLDRFMATFPPGRTYGHRELVQIAMREDMMHGATQNSFDDKDVNCCNWGVSIRRLPRRRYAVIHTMASPMILHPNAQDAEELNRVGYGGLDRGTNLRLFNENRIKLAASSDLCFFVELTRHDRNVPPMTANLLNADRNCNANENIWNNVAILWDGDAEP